MGHREFELPDDPSAPPIEPLHTPSTAPRAPSIAPVGISTPGSLSNAPSAMSNAPGTMSNAPGAMPNAFGPRANAPSALSTPPGALSTPPPRSPSLPPMATEFEEAERALALLQGQNPDKVRYARIRKVQDDLEVSEAARRIAERNAATTAERSKRRKKIAAVVLTSVVVITAVSAIASVAWKASSQRGLDEGALTKVTAAWEKRGFTAVGRGFGVDATATADIAEGCMVALASDENGASIPVTIQVGGQGSGQVGPVGPGGPVGLTGGATGDATREVDGAAMQCWCEPAKVRATAKAKPGQRSSVAILRIAGEKLGGPIVIPSLDLPVAQLTPSSEACARTMFDAFAQQKTAPASAADNHAPATVTAKLARSGMRWVASSGAHEFVVVPGEKDGCYLAMSTSPDDRLSLRVDAGKRPIEDRPGPAITWCDDGTGPRSVWRAGSPEGHVDVFAGPSRRVGGMLGMRALTQALTGIEPASWITPTLELLRRDAMDSLVASGGLASASRPLDVASVQRGSDARMVALSLAPDAMITLDPSARDKLRCIPALEPGVVQTVCAEASAAVWEHVAVKGVIGAAEAPLPPWAGALTAATEAPALLATAELYGAIRTLTSERYDPVLFEGVRDLGASVDVMGRAGEDSIAAFGLTPQMPWVGWLITTSMPSSTSSASALAQGASAGTSGVAAVASSALGVASGKGAMGSMGSTGSTGRNSASTGGARKAGGSSVVALKPGAQVMLTFGTVGARPSPERRIVVFRRPME